MNTVLTQEIIRYVKKTILHVFLKFTVMILLVSFSYNRLLNMIHTSLQELLKAMKGLVVLSQALEDMSKSLYNNAVPTMWTKVVCLRLCSFFFPLPSNSICFVTRPIQV